jgi:hypothetical protein
MRLARKLRPFQRPLDRAAVLDDVRRTHTFLLQLQHIAGVGRGRAAAQDRLCMLHVDRTLCLTPSAS